MSEHRQKSPISLGHRVWRLLPVEQRRQLLARAAAWLAPRPDLNPPPVEPGLAIIGEFSRASGLGEGARLMLEGARKLGLRTWAIDAPSLIGEAPEVEFQSDPPPPPGVPLVAHINAPSWPLALMRLPRAVISGRRIIGHWSWELPVAPPSWRVAAPFVHDLWVLSRFTAAAMEPLKPGRVRVVPPPLAIAPPMPSALDRAAFGWPADAIVTLVSFDLASSFARKNPLAAIAAFREAFGERRDRVLVLKVGHVHHAPDDFDRIRAAADAPNIRLETRLMPSADRHAMTAAADIVLSMHRSEGFGLVLAEAMYLGKPAVATAWSGNMDFMDESNAALVPYSLIQAVDPRRVYGGALWAEPDVGAAAVHLRRLAGDASTRAAVGARAAAAIRHRLDPGCLSAAVAGLSA